MKQHRTQRPQNQSPQPPAPAHENKGPNKKKKKKTQLLEERTKAEFKKGRFDTPFQREYL